MAMLLMDTPPPPVKPEPPGRGGAPLDIDQRVFLNASWDDFETTLAIRGDVAGPRMAFLDGVIELMSPSINHECVKKTIARLVEAYADEHEIDLNGCGSCTLKNKIAKCALEPDECYVLGPVTGDVPHLAIEVIWTKGGLNKLEIYRSLGVGEVWIWEQGAGLSVYLLKKDRYKKAPKSALFPGLDIMLLRAYIEYTNQSQAVREFRKALRR